MQYLRRLIAVALLALLASGPALALSPSAFQVLFSGGWWLPGASVDMNFAQSKYYGCDISCVSVSRASTKTNLLPNSASGFAYVTFASGVPAIDANGFLIEEARTNQLFNSTAPATQTTGSLGTGAYTLWVNGSGSAQMSAGTGTGCGTGTATNGSPVNFTITVAGTCTVTKTGTLNAFQLELGAFGTSLIVTAGASATRAADVPQLIGPAAAAALAAKAAFFQTALVATFVNAQELMAFDTGGTSLNYSSGNNLARVQSAGNNATATFGSGTTAGVAKSAFGFDNVSMTAKANAGTQATAAFAWAAGTTAYLGNRSAGDRALNGYMQRFALSPSKGQFDGATAP